MQAWVLGLPALIWVEFAHAAETGEGGSPWDFLWKLVNFIALILIIYWFAKKPVSGAMNASAENARKLLEDARNAEERVKAQQKEMRAKIAGLEQETKTMVEKARKEALEEKERVLEEGRREIMRMREQARFSIEQEYRKAEHELRQWVAVESVKLAEEKVKKKMTPARQNKLVKKFLDQLIETKEIS